MLENPEKKPSDPEVTPGVIKSKISTENLFSYCHGRVFKREQVMLALLRTMFLFFFHNPQKLPAIGVTGNMYYQSYVSLVILPVIPVICVSGNFISGNIISNNFSPGIFLTFQSNSTLHLETNRTSKLIEVIDTYFQH